MKRIVAFILILGLLFQGDYAYAATGIQISINGGAYTNYTDKQIVVKVNNKSIKLIAGPGIIKDGYAMLPYDELFVKSSIKAKGSYQSKTKEFTITYYDKVLKLKVGSKTGYLNGKKVNLPVAPMQVRYRASNRLKTLVPSRFVAETLGMNYVWTSSNSTVSIAEKGLGIQYGGKTYRYTKAQAKITVDGVAVKTGMPGLIIDNTTLVPLTAVFNKSSIKATTTYDSKTKEIVVKKGSNTVKMTAGSKMAYINGVKKTMPTAAWVIKNLNNNGSYVMVPGEFVTKGLGYTYTWNNSKVTSVIQTQKTVTPPVTPVEPEKPTEPEEKTITFSSTDTAKISELSALKDEVSFESDGVAYEKGNVLSGYNNVDNVLTLVSDQPITSATISNTTMKQLKVTVQNASCTDANVKVQNSIVTDVISSNNGTYASFVLNLAVDKAQFKASLSQDRKVLELTVLPNYLTNVTVQNTATKDIITITGVSALSPNVALDSTKKNLTVNLPYTEGSIKDVTKKINGYNMDSVAIKNLALSIQLSTSTVVKCNYSIVQKDNQTIIEITKLLNSYSVKINKPSSVKENSYTYTDDYLNKRLILTVPGNQVAFYNKNKPEILKNAATSVTAKLNAKGDTELYINTSKIRAFDVEEYDGAYYITICAPKEMYSKIVVLDPGHGGTDSGAIGNGLKEKEVVQKIVLTYAKKYFDQNKDIKVYYTRLSDTYPTLLGRANIANEVEADLFISVHINSATNTSAKGTEVFYHSTLNNTTSSGLSSSKVATYANTYLNAAVGSTNRGVKRSNLSVLRNTTMPGCLMEVAFISNSSDAAILKNTSKLDKVGKSVYDTVVKCFSTYPPKR